MTDKELAQKILDLVGERTTFSQLLTVSLVFVYLLKTKRRFKKQYRRSLGGFGC